MNPTYVRGLLCNTNGGLNDSNLDSMNHRAWSGYLSCDDSSYSIDEKLTSFSSNIIGCLSIPTVNDTNVLIHGEIYGDYSSILDNIINSDNVETLTSNIHELYKLDGSYCMVVHGKLGTICLRDPLGCKPLYIGKNNNSISVSTQKSILVNSNFNVEDFIPGTAMILENELTIDGRNLSPTSYSQYDADPLLTLLKNSITSRIGNKKTIGVSFS